MEISLHNEISVYESTQLYGQMGKFRFLQFSDGAVQGAMDLKHPKRIVLEYPRAIIHLMECNNPAFASMFVIGHGIGTIAGHYSDKYVIVAEIDEKVVELSRRFFHYSKDNVVVGDGRCILKQEPSNALDYIILDAFSAKGTPFHLMTMDFFQMTKEKLHPRGTIIINLMGRTRNDKFIDAVHTTLGSVYAYSKAFCLQGTDDSDLRNILLVGSDNPIEFHAPDMAGFVEMELRQGHIIVDRES